MKERDWNQLSEELIELIGNYTEATRVKAVVRANCIELVPDGEENDGISFHHTEQVVDFCRCKRLSNYVYYDFVTKNVVCMIF